MNPGYELVGDDESGESVYFGGTKEYMECLDELFDNCQSGIEAGLTVLPSEKPEGGFYITYRKGLTAREWHTVWLRVVECGPAEREPSAADLDFRDHTL